MEGSAAPHFPFRKDLVRRTCAPLDVALSVPLASARAFRCKVHQSLLSRSVSSVDLVDFSGGARFACPCATWGAQGVFWLPRRGSWLYPGGGTRRFGGLGPVPLHVLIRRHTPNHSTICSLWSVELVLRQRQSPPKKAPRSKTDILKMTEEPREQRYRWRTTNQQ